MSKFSIIIPVYNVEKYISKCLDSIFNQSYKNFEVIVINDGSTDKSLEIIEKYNVKIINQKNMGVSEARNNGVKHANGDYLLFVDSDDYLEKKLLENLNLSLRNDPDIVRFRIKEVRENGNYSKKYPEKKFTNKNGVDAFTITSKYHYVENAWAYIFKKSFYEKNKFTFKKGHIHEDFGLIPLVIMKAQTVNSISYIGYNYLQRSGSIMHENDYNNVVKKVNDFYYHYQFLISEIDNTNLDSKIFKSFIANSLILKICELKWNDYKEYKLKLKKQKVFDNILQDTLLRKIKKVLFIISPKMAIKLIK